MCRLEGLLVQLEIRSSSFCEAVLPFEIAWAVSEAYWLVTGVGLLVVNFVRTLRNSIKILDREMLEILFCGSGFAIRPSVYQIISNSFLQHYLDMRGSLL
jgi:hypothetical protein